MNAFANLSTREKVLILAVLPLVVLVVGYRMIWQPVQAARLEARADIAAYRLVVETAALAKRGDASAPRPIDNTPIATRITQSADTAGLSLRRIEPEGQGSRVTLDDTPFATVLTWLADLEISHSVTARAIEIDRRPEPGIVSARLLLEVLP